MSHMSDTVAVDDGDAGIMDIVVLTAALSSVNSGLYSTGRILRSLSAAGSAPRFLGVMSRGGVPYGGVLLTASVYVLGVVLNLVVPGQSFEIALYLSALGILSMWLIHSPSTALPGNTSRAWRSRYTGASWTRRQGPTAATPSLAVLV